MRVADYRYVDNAAALGNLGFLADDRDVSRRRTQLPRLDDPAFFFEGMAERHDLLMGYGDVLSFGVQETAYGYKDGVDILEDINGSTTEYDTASAIGVSPFYTNLKACKPVSISGYGTMEAAVDALLGGVRAKRAIDGVPPVIGNRYPMKRDRLPWWPFVKEASDVLYDFRCFRVGSGYHYVTHAETDDPAAPQGAAFSNALYYSAWSRSRGVEYPRRTWGAGTSVTIVARKRANGGTAFDSDRYAACAAVIKATAHREWLDMDGGESFSDTQDAYTVLWLVKSGSEFTVTKSPTDVATQEAWLDQAFGGVPAISGDGQDETYVTLQGIPYLVFFLAPLAFSANRFAT